MPGATGAAGAVVTLGESQGHPTANSADLDGDGTVGLADPILFASAFDSRDGDAACQANLDLDSDGAVLVPDFLLSSSGRWGMRVLKARW